MTLKNRMHNCHNPYQGQLKKVLCVCSAGLLRSPTIAWVLSQEPFNFNTRSVGSVSEFALIPLDMVHLHWADEIVVVEKSQKDLVENLMPDPMYKAKKNKIHCLDIPDNYAFRDPELIGIIKEKCLLLWPSGKASGLHPEID